MLTKRNPVLANVAVLHAHILTQSALAPVMLPKSLSTFPVVDDPDQESIRKLLLNSWSAEYALRATPTIADEEYLQRVIGWVLPQAYYSTLFSARALLMVSGQTIGREDVVSRLVGELVGRGVYPQSLSFQVTREPGIYQLTDENLSDVLLPVRTQYLRRHQLPGMQVRYSDDAELYPTTWFDVLATLRTCTDRVDTNGAPAAITAADIMELHQQLTHIVRTINNVHETYLHRLLGPAAWKGFLYRLPTYLRDAIDQWQHN